MTNPGQKWIEIPETVAEEIKHYLLQEGRQEDQIIGGAAEAWRVRFSDATLTYYKSGTLYSTGSSDPAVGKAWEFISLHTGPRFEPSTKDILIGLDETGKGEVIGHTVLAGVLIPAELGLDLEKLVSVADTKQKREVAYWDKLFRQIDQFKRKGLECTVEKIPPWHVDRYNLNKIMDVVYQRILATFFRHVETRQSRIVIDDYGVGASLGRYLRAMTNAGSEVVVTTGADDHFLEARVASVLAKREREKVIEALHKSQEYHVDGQTVGSGNAGDPETLAWLRAWKATGRQWPWFVKRSFKTIRALDGIAGTAKKEAPPIRDDILSAEFLKEFEDGRLSITSLSVVCPSCGAVSKAALVTPSDQERFVGRCINCRKPIPNLDFTLRYYCGYVLPDSNIITGGLLSKDLERSLFFEGFTVLLDATVRRECDTPGGKQELGRLARFSAIGRIGLEEVPSSILGGTSFERDEAILRVAIQYNAVLVTNDQNMKAAAQAHRVFVLSTN